MAGDPAGLSGCVGTGIASHPGDAIPPTRMAVSSKRLGGIGVSKKHLAESQRKRRSRQARTIVSQESPAFRPGRMSTFSARFRRRLGLAAPAQQQA